MPEPATRAVTGYSPFLTLASMVCRAPGCRIFRNFFRIPEEGIEDVVSDGELSCVYFASGLLTLCGLFEGVQLNIDYMVEALQDSGWRKDLKFQHGRGELGIAIWGTEPGKRHLGFVVGSLAVSTSSYVPHLCVVRHSLTMKDGRKINQIWTHPKLRGLLENAIYQTLYLDLREGPRSWADLEP